MILPLSELYDTLALRDEASAERDAADARVQTYNAILLESLQAVAAVRHQMPDGTLLQIIQQKPRRTIIPEKLLARGVHPQVIEDSTDVKPVKPFVRVDRPRHDDEAGAPVDAGAMPELAPPSPQ